MNFKTYLSSNYDINLDNKSKMIVRYGYYYERARGNNEVERLHVNVFAFSRDVETGMILFGHVFYRGTMADFSEYRSRLRMTALNRLLKRPTFTFLPKGNYLDEFCKIEENQMKIQPHMSFDGSLKFVETENVYRHYRPYAIIYLLVQILRNPAYKNSNYIVREMVSNKNEGVNVSNVNVTVPPAAG